MATLNQQFCLRWNNHQPNFISVFSSLLRSETMCDVTLATEGKHILAHKIVLSACSAYFQMLFSINPCKHPIVILKDVQFKDLKTLIDFVYFGEVNVSQEHLPSLLKTAETLQIKGLTEMPEKSITLNSISHTPPEHNKVDSPLGSPSAYKRKRMRKTSTESSTGSPSNVGKEEGDPANQHSTQHIQHSHHNVSQIPTSMKQHEVSLPEDQRQPTPQMDDRSSISLSSTEPGPSTSKPSDLLLPVKTIILTTQSKSLDFSESSSTSTSTQINDSTANMGSKQRRFLMRQHRVKKEYDEDKEGEGVRVIERQCSEPAPATENLLSVPQVSYLTKQHSHPLIISTSSTTSPSSPSFHISSPTETSSTSRPIKIEEFRRASSTPQYTLSLPSSIGTLRDTESRSSHCPELRQGPALGCNFCWNTVDNHGRILRRKTKYHCPECQTNLCIVPCFQQYHESLSHDLPPSSTALRRSGVTPLLTPAIVKTSSL